MRYGISKQQISPTSADTAYVMLYVEGRAIQSCMVRPSDRSGLPTGATISDAAWDAIAVVLADHYSAANVATRAARNAEMISDVQRETRKYAARDAHDEYNRKFYAGEID